MSKSSRGGSRENPDPVSEHYRELVDQLTRRLGARLVAYVLGKSSTLAFRAPPGPVGLAQNLDRLQALSTVLDTLYEPDQVAAAWLMGLNPLLGDVSPARLLRAQGAAVTPALLAAAREYRR